MTPLKSLVLAATALTALATAAQAATTVGTYGTSGADGVVVAPPSGSTYNYITTKGGVVGAGTIASVGNGNASSSNPATGSSWTSDAFTAAAGDVLSFNFNYVTSDGAGYSDYAWAALLDGSQTVLGYLFTARTTTSGNTSPGFGLPTNISTLTPGATPIQSAGTQGTNNPGTLWSPLGDDSGDCYNNGCGFTGWIGSTYTIATAGTYYLQFGVTNWQDGGFASGLAWSGARVGTTVIPDDTVAPVPVPATLPLLAGALAAPALLRRRKKG